MKYSYVWHPSAGCQISFIGYALKLCAYDTTFGVRISGDSMEPEFHDGQIAWVLQQESVANGEIGIFALNGEAYIKKLQNDKNGIFLISLNEKYAPIKVSENDRLDIFGKVLGKCNASDIAKHCR